MKTFKYIILPVLLFLLVSCAPLSAKDGSYYVYSVIDGDTVILANKEHLRYIGIDTPELRKRESGVWVWRPQPYALQAYELNKKLVEGKSVRLEFDKETKDRYGRWLAYVFIDGKFVNEELLRRGYATVFIKQPNTKYLESLLAAEREARQNKRGIWSEK